MKEKHFKIIILAIPVIAIILIVIASYDWAYLSCLMENNDKEDTASYCYMSSRAIGYENLP
jgi:hypothetical protein